MEITPNRSEPYHTVDGKKALIGPTTVINKEIKYMYLFVIQTIGFYKKCVRLFPGGLEVLGSTGRLIGSISTYSGTYKCPGSRVMTKKSRRTFSSVHGMLSISRFKFLAKARVGIVSFVYVFFGFM